MALALVGVRRMGGAARRVEVDPERALLADRELVLGRLAVDQEAAPGLEARGGPGAVRAVLLPDQEQQPDPPLAGLRAAAPPAATMAAAMPFASQLPRPCSALVVLARGHVRRARCPGGWRRPARAARERRRGCPVRGRPVWRAPGSRRARARRRAVGGRPLRAVGVSQRHQGAGQPSNVGHPSMNAIAPPARPHGGAPVGDKRRNRPSRILLNYAQVRNSTKRSK